MHRFALAALSAALVLSACNEQSHEPTSLEQTPAPLFKKEARGSCLDPFPSLAAQISAVYPAGKLRNEAVGKVADIQELCEKQKGKGKVKQAQHKALKFVGGTLKKYKKHQLPDATPFSITDLVTGLFLAVGLETGDLSGAFGKRGAVDVYDETDTEDFHLVNEEGSGALTIPAGCLPTSLITIIPLPDGPQLVNTGGRRQFPPFFDINAENPEDQHFLDPACRDLIVGFCVEQRVLDQTDNPQIGHNFLLPAEEEETEIQFEVLRAANADEYADLGLACPKQANPGFFEEEGEGEGIGVGPSGGLQGLALSAWHKAGGYIRPIANVFLPQPLHATTDVPKIGLGSGGRSISPFGVVDDVVLESTFNGDPGGQTFTENSTITWQVCTKGCSDLFPRVRVADFFDSGVSDADVSVTLIRLEGEGEESTVEFGEGSELTETTNSSGEAEFDNLIVSEEGTYLLEFTVPGNEFPLRSGQFFVSEGE
jgi:hypothetical protein